MADISENNQLYLVPDSCRIASDHRRLHLCSVRHYEDLEELPQPPVLCPGSSESFRVLRRYAEGVYGLLPPSAYSCRLQSGDNLEITATQHGFILKAGQAYAGGDVLTVALRDRPEIGLKVSVSAEAPVRLRLFPPRYVLDLQRRHLLMSPAGDSPGSRGGKLKWKCFGAEELDYLQLPEKVSAAPGERLYFRVLAEYGGGRCCWADAADLDIVLSEPQCAECALSPDGFTVPYDAPKFALLAAAPSSAPCTVTVKSRRAEDVECRLMLDIVDREAYKQTFGLTEPQHAALRALQDWVEDGSLPNPVKYLEGCGCRWTENIKHSYSFDALSLTASGEVCSFTRTAEELMSILRELADGDVSAESGSALSLGPAERGISVTDFDCAAEKACRCRLVRQYFFELLALRGDMLRRCVFGGRGSDDIYTAYEVRMFIEAYNLVILSLLKKPETPLRDVLKARYYVWPNLIEADKFKS